MRESTQDRSSGQEAAVETEDPWDEDRDDELRPDREEPPRHRL